MGAYLISLYSCVMIPPAALIAAIASSMTLVGVLSGYEMMTAFWGIVAANATATSARIEMMVNFIVSMALLGEYWSDAACFVFVWLSETRLNTCTVD